MSRRGRLAVLGGVVLVAAVAAVVVVATGSFRSTPGGHARRAAAAQRYGTIPAWLPRPAAPAHAVGTASAAHPALAAVEGDTVHARLPAGSTSITAVGPAFPRWVSLRIQRGRWTDADVAPVTFTVTLAAAHGTVPLRAGAFSVLTAAGQLVHPALTAADGRRAPSRVTAGRPVTVKLTTGLADGDGALRWAPDGRTALVSWVYQLELD